MPNQMKTSPTALRRKGFPPSFWQGRKSDVSVRHVRHVLAEAQNWRCCWCGKKCDPHGPGWSTPTIEHVIPKALGGNNTWLNLAMACAKCNGNRQDDGQDELELLLELGYFTQDDLDEEIRQEQEKYVNRTVNKVRNYILKGQGNGKKTHLVCWMSALRGYASNNQYADMLPEVIGHLTEIDKSCYNELFDKRLEKMMTDEIIEIAQRRIEDWKTVTGKKEGISFLLNSMAFKVGYYGEEDKPYFDTFSINVHGLEEAWHKAVCAERQIDRMIRW